MFFVNNNTTSSYGSTPSVYKMVMVVGLLAVTAIVSIVLNKAGYDFELAVIVPLAVAAAILCLGAPKTFAAIILVAQYLFVGLGRYMQFKVGIFFDGCLLVFLFVITFNTLFAKVEWKRGFNSATFFAFIWFLYCLFELFNLRTYSYNAWLVGVRWTSVYMLLIILFVPVLITDIKSLRAFIYIFSGLTLLAAVWIIRQKYIGLDQAELAWLSDPRIRNTHVLPFGIRYFGFYSDAANAAVSLALSGSFFIVTSLFIKKRKERNYFFFVGAVAFWVSLYTGTRSQMIVPLIALILMVLCSRNGKLMFWSALFLISIFVFFRYTEIGNGNVYIWRARAAFHYDSDASYISRVINHKKVAAYMKGKPFGVGIGMAETRALKYNAESEIAKINVDSWIYLLYVETGIVGLSLYLAMFAFFFIHGIRLALFKLRTKFIRGVVVASTGCVMGVLAASYGNEVLAQFPNGVIVFTLVAIVFVSPYLDKEYLGIENEENKKAIS